MQSFLHVNKQLLKLRPESQEDQRLNGYSDWHFFDPIQKWQSAYLNKRVFILVSVHHAVDAADPAAITFNWMTPA